VERGSRFVQEGGAVDVATRLTDAGAVQYVVALSRTVAPAELHSAGAHIDEWFGDIVVVRISDAGLAVLRQCPWVRYVQARCEANARAGEPRPLAPITNRIAPSPWLRPHGTREPTDTTGPETLNQSAQGIPMYMIHLVVS